MSLRVSASPDADAAAWILCAIRDFDYTVASIVPPVFDAYARVFHPASRDRGEQRIAVSWAEVARANAREMHPAAEWGSITGCWDYQSQPGLWDGPPLTGRLPGEIAQRLLAVLVEHTDDPGQGFFGVWEGWGTPTGSFALTPGTPELARRRQRDAFDAEVAAWVSLLEAGASFQLPHRGMRLLRGPLVAIEDFYQPYHRESSLCLCDPPSLWWPADASWIVGTDIDLMSTYVAAGSRAMQALLADEHLEALPVPDCQSVTWEADTLNPLPKPP
ncbi:MAG TPA: hypothetical protein VMB51_00935 [Solirubrobacteraceae bacterium]|nr:hypothetical protein [Solirubrobacteraceae bacterium]